ncbi:MAG: hypothetical protein U0T83_10960 [Bacteriovoracaceae bacterium]
MNMRFKRVQILTIATALLLGFACSKEKSTSKSSSSSSDSTSTANAVATAVATVVSATAAASTPTAYSAVYGDTEGSTGTGCLTPGVGDSKLSDYYSFPFQSPGVWDATPVWSSTKLPDPNVLMTDTKLNIRVLVRAAPYANTTTCKNSFSYSAVEMAVGIRTKYDSAPLEKITFKNIKVNECSQVRSFKITPTLKLSNEPVILEVSNVKWDYACKIGWNSADCPFNYVWKSSCFEAILQVSTDYTKDFQK